MGLITIIYRDITALNSKMEMLRSRLNKLVEKGASKNDILKLSCKLDKLIVAYQKIMLQTS